MRDSVLCQKFAPLCISRTSQEKATAHSLHEEVFLERLLIFVNKITFLKD